MKNRLSPALHNCLALLSLSGLALLSGSCSNPQVSLQEEPLLRVGIMESDTIAYSLAGQRWEARLLPEHRIERASVVGEERTVVDTLNEELVIDAATVDSAGGIVLHGVTIGKQFHWQQQEDQAFVGGLHLVATDEALHAINYIPVEEYLKSVISSEMSAMNNLELLKTHAIISRSWVLRQLPAYQTEAMPEQPNAVREGNRFVKFWDSEDHALFDVCADDHCQRYQGTTRQVSPLVAAAIDATRGQVLVPADGKEKKSVCDARFSKCCGGRSELFSSCWQDIDFSYLQPVEDPWCDTSDTAVLRLVLNNYDQQTLHFHDWEVTYSRRELTDLVNRKLAAEVPDFEPFSLIAQLEALDRGPSGRIIHLCLVDCDGDSLVIGKELLIRKALSESHLYSSAFEVLPQQPGNGPDDLITLRGHGWGHGAGLCQIGAANMSQQGKTYTEILQHYFVETEVETLYR